ncbi:hypothetical protein Amal_03149 [Acetobacter malorum]|uniref:Uncharacterized protein n=1 Tax=Acetobacter malorum TaxID=178901 RepID=A0A177G5Q4_9PROT|nr:hypothetical protein Amal_03149 [Acetobacter malorum]
MNRCTCGACPDNRTNIFRTCFPVKRDNFITDLDIFNSDITVGGADHAACKEANNINSIQVSFAVFRCNRELRSFICCRQLEGRRSVNWRPIARQRINTINIGIAISRHTINNDRIVVCNVGDVANNARRGASRNFNRSTATSRCVSRSRELNQVRRRGCVTTQHQSATIPDNHLRAAINNIRVTERQRTINRHG